MEKQTKIEVPVMAELAASGKRPEYLFWVGCAGAIDYRYMKVTRAFATILNHLGTDYGVLGTEETCTGDPARRAGNEMLYQMQAMMVIETLNMYEVKKIVTICPHCYNVFKHEYPDLGGNYEVIHYTELLAESLRNGTLKVEKEKLAGKTATFHDPCYLGRMNNIYDAPRFVMESLGLTLAEMPRNKSFGLCCGGGGAQMFKDAEKGGKEVFIERTEEAMETGASIIGSSCPFCMTMLTDGIKYKDKEAEMENLDVAELVAMALPNRA
jgi:heterodisulfide reductase subunit D